MKVCRNIVGCDALAILIVVGALGDNDDLVTAATRTQPLAEGPLSIAARLGTQIGAGA